MSYTDGRDAVKAGRAATREAIRDGREAVKDAAIRTLESGPVERAAFGAGIATEIGAGIAAPVTKLSGAAKRAAGKGVKAGGIVALVAAGLGALAIFSRSTRSHRRFKESDVPNLPDEMMDEAFPRVLSAEELMAQQAIMQQQQATMMGQMPVEGRHASKVKMERSGMDAGINPGAPDVGDIDGKTIEDLGSGRSI